jgi:signal transduction histidine kinase
MPLALGDYEIRPVVERAIERLATLAQDRAIVVLTDINDDLPPAAIDRELIARVVQNLLANAIKFSSRGSTVLVRACLDTSAAQPMLCVAVSDRGIGIAPKDQERVFTKFGQVGESRGGTGLGLTFSKLAVEAHDGRIWLESTPGFGSNFYFTVPLASR